MSPSESAYSAVSAAPPMVPVSIIAAAVEQQFSLAGSFVPLVSERDQNLKLTSESKATYVVKLSSLAETPLVNAFRTAVFLHLEDLDTPQVPKLVRTRGGSCSGQLDYEGQCYALRVVGYLPGDLLASVAIDADIAEDFGAKLAALNVALQGFRHDGEHPSLLWDLQRVTELRNLLQLIDNVSVRRGVAGAIDDFEANVSLQIDMLRAQVIHGDANPENILVSGSPRCVSGFIDFGDMLRAPLIFDVAIAAAYLRTDARDALELIVPFVSGYHRTLPLADVELGLLFDLVRARLATTITLLFWRLAARADDDPYRQKTLQREADAAHFLQALDTLGRNDFVRALRRGL